MTVTIAMALVSSNGASAVSTVSSALDSERLGAAPRARVLLVDDDRAVRNALRRVLEQRGYSVFACGSGREALDQLAIGGYDVMISDVRMPGMSGLGLLRAVREHDLDLPVILVTGNPEVASATEAVAYGAFQYLIKPVASERLDQVVERAATAGRMAHVKRQYIDELGSAAVRAGDRAGTSTKLDRALASLWIAYQPIFDARQETVFAYEALMRSDEPELPNPQSVLSAAERVARLPELGSTVRRLAALGLAEAGEATLFVNLHPEDLSDEGLFEPSAPLTLVAPRIVLEVTERASLDGIRDLRERVARLRALGFRIAIDDLGAGYAGLTSFTQLEPEFVKLDMALIRDIDQHEMKRKIVSSMVELCHDMGQQIIAEGVETLEERNVLIDLGCDLLQGFLLATPSRYPQLEQPKSLRIPR